MITNLLDLKSKASSTIAKQLFSVDLIHSHNLINLQTQTKASRATQRLQHCGRNEQCYS